MQQNPWVGLGDNKLPVFAIPNQLSFYLDDPSQHKQMITIYNPYDFPIKYKVLCTAPNKYVVTMPEGIIKVRCYIFIFIKLGTPTQSLCDVTDKFRIQMFEHGRRTLLGKKDIPATLLNGNPPKCDSNSSDKEKFEQLINNSASGSQQLNQHSMTRSVRTSSGPNIFIMMAAVVCIAALMLPTEGMQEDLRFPSYLHLSLNQKLICAYTLGLVTMVLLRTQ